MAISPSPARQEPEPFNPQRDLNPASTKPHSKQSMTNPSHQTPSGHLTPVTPTHSDINPRKTQSHGELNPPNSRSEHNTSTQEPQHAFIPSKPRHQTRALQQADLPVHPSPAAHRHKAHATLEAKQAMTRWPHKEYQHDHAVPPRLHPSSHQPSSHQDIAAQDAHDAKIPARDEPLMANLPQPRARRGNQCVDATKPDESPE